jgi:galactose mutarotase-like enzyme
MLTAMSAPSRYAIERTSDPLETHVLVDHETDARVTVAPSRGGMITRFTLRGEPVLYLDESTLRDTTKNVRGGIPILFPISGPLRDDRFVVGAETFVMKQHGFARNRAWPATYEKFGDHVATLGLELFPDDASRAQYPFDVAVRVLYSLEAGALTIQRDVVNRDARPAPIQPGLHPYFFLDDARKGEARIETDATRAWDNVQKREVDVAPPIDLTVKELDLHLLDHEVKGAPLGRRTSITRPGRKTIVIDYSDDHDVLVLWTLAQKDFVCVEPWVGRANALDEKRATMVPPNGRHVSRVTISLEG